jgi:AcrR family transcriptional regulator
MPQTSPSDRPRRTQQERRDGTRRVLIEATVACLCDRGYGGTTTLEVERRAGVSRGARIHHFPTKAALLASAVDHLYDDLSDHYESAFGADVALAELDRFRSGLRLLWSIFKRPAYTAVLELNMAARTDDELRACLRSVADRHRELAIEAALRFFPSLGRGRSHALIEAIHAALTGLLLQRNVVETAQCEVVEELVLGLLQDLVALQLSNGRGDAA